MNVIDDHLSDQLRSGPVVGAPFFARELTLTSDERQARLYHDTFVRRDYVEVILFVGGDGYANVLDQDGELRRDPHDEGCLHLYRPQDRRCRWGVFGPTPLTFLQVGLAETDWEAFARFARLDLARVRGKDPVAVRVKTEGSPVRASFDRLISSASTAPTMFDLLEFLIRVVPLLVPPDDLAVRPSPPWLVRSLAAMQDEPNLREGLPRLLEVAHVSHRHLSRATARYLGATPARVVADIRIRHASRLLGTTFDSMMSIADRCGFSSPAQFSTTFKRMTGVTPREYRTQAIGGLASSRARRSDA